MNLFLFCSSRCSLQNKKKIFEIGSVDREIIAKYYFFGFQIHPQPEKIVFCDYFTIYRSNFKYLFFILKRASRATKQKKVHRNPITGLRDNAFNCLFKFPPNFNST